MFLLPSHVRIFFVAPCRDSSLSNVYIQQAPVAAPKEPRQSTDVAGASASDYKPAKTPRRKAISAPRNFQFNRKIYFEIPAGRKGNANSSRQLLSGVAPFALCLHFCRRLIRIELNHSRFGFHCVELAHFY